MAPGYIDNTEGVKRFAEAVPGRGEVNKANNPVGVVGHGADIAHMVMYFCSPARALRLGSGDRGRRRLERRPAEAEDRTDLIRKGRIEAFSDGVFAIAITLLVLTIPQPDDYKHLADALWNQWPAYAAYVVSFAVIGDHVAEPPHGVRPLRRLDRNLVYLNLVLLATVVLIPYPTQVFGEALQRGEGEKVAAVFYSVVMTLNADRLGVGLVLRLVAAATPGGTTSRRTNAGPPPSSSRSAR